MYSFYNYASQAIPNKDDWFLEYLRLLALHYRPFGLSWFEMGCTQTWNLGASLCKLKSNSSPFSLTWRHMEALWRDMRNSRRRIWMLALSGGIMEFTQLNEGFVWVPSLVKSPTTTMLRGWLDQASRRSRIGTHLSSGGVSGWPSGKATMRLGSMMISCRHGLCEQAPSRAGRVRHENTTKANEPKRRA